jgi:mono/diheme cytochrome c family protein
MLARNDRKAYRTMRVSTYSMLALLAFCALIAAGCGGGPKDAAKELSAACERQIAEIKDAKSESKIIAAKSSEDRESQEHTVQCAGQKVEAPAAATTDEAAAGDKGTTEPSKTAAIDPASRDMFTEKCAACHTLADAGATGAVGPNLDELTLTADVVTKQVENGGGAMPPGLYTGEDAAKVGEYVAAASKASAG